MDIKVYEAPEFSIVDVTEVVKQGDGQNKGNSMPVG